MVRAMIATTHMLVGGAAALKTRSIRRAVAIGALTHLLIDAIPHRDYRRKAFGGLALLADLAVGAMSVCGLSHGSTTALAGALGGVLPDVLRAAEQTAGVPATSWAHDTAHTDRRPAAWDSAMAQGAIALAAAAALWAGTHGGRRQAGRPR
jgi:hypothetical protein